MRSCCFRCGHARAPSDRGEQWLQVEIAVSLRRLDEIAQHALLLRRRQIERGGLRRRDVPIQPIQHRLGRRLIARALPHALHRRLQAGARRAVLARRAVPHAEGARGDVCVPQARRARAPLLRVVHPGELPVVQTAAARREHHVRRGHRRGAQPAAQHLEARAPLAHVGAARRRAVGARGVQLIGRLLAAAFAVLPRRLELTQRLHLPRGAEGLLATLRRARRAGAVGVQLLQRAQRPLGAHLHLLGHLLARVGEGMQKFGRLVPLEAEEVVRPALARQPHHRVVEERLARRERVVVRLLLLLVLWLLSHRREPQVLGAILRQVDGLQRGVRDRGLLDEREGGAADPPEQQGVVTQPQQRLVRRAAHTDQPPHLLSEAFATRLVVLGELRDVHREQQRPVGDHQVFAAECLGEQKQALALLRGAHAVVHAGHRVLDRVEGVAERRVVRPRLWRLLQQRLEEQWVLAQPLHRLDQPRAHRLPCRLLHLAHRLLDGGVHLSERAEELLRRAPLGAELRVRAQEGRESSEGLRDVCRSDGRPVRLRLAAEAEQELLVDAEERLHVGEDGGDRVGREVGREPRADLTQNPQVRDVRRLSGEDLLEDAHRHL
mmetsp:Transcript_35774/g.81958  ORF Transcript_35774/g.81958 Transcript_35774/m.81958 type:complete len:607 (+) Transcript_35774:436-2256(+)